MTSTAAAGSARRAANSSRYDSARTRSPLRQRSPWSARIFASSSFMLHRVQSQAAARAVERAGQFLAQGVGAAAAGGGDFSPPPAAGPLLGQVTILVRELAPHRLQKFLPGQD